MIGALHATRHEAGWVECDGKVSYELHNWRSTASVSLLPGIVEAGVPIIMFAGAEDLICNYKGIERMLENLEWNGQTGMGVSIGSHRIDLVQVVTHAHTAGRTPRCKNGI